MIEYDTYKGKIKIKHKLFAPKLYWLDFYKLVSYSYMQTGVYNPLFIKKRRFTLIVDLDMQMETVFSNFKSKTRNEIRRAFNEHIEFSTEENKQNFISFYNKFALKKGQGLLSYDSFIRLNNLVITKATIDDRPLVMHAYLIYPEGAKARLINSASRRLEKNANKALIGWANRFLHFQDMIYFKNQHITAYDLGGTAHHTKKRDQHRIEAFKREFGGETVVEYFYESIPHFIGLHLYSFLNKHFFKSTE